MAVWLSKPSCSPRRWRHLLFGARRYSGIILTRVQPTATVFDSGSETPIGGRSHTVLILVYTCHHSCNLGSTGSSGRCGLSSTVWGATPCALLDVAKRLVYFFEMFLCDRVLAAFLCFRHQCFLLPGGCTPPCISLYGRRSRADFFGICVPGFFEKCSATWIFWL